MKNAQKQWIKFVEKQSHWKWDEFRGDFFVNTKSRNTDFSMFAHREDLIGWQLAFARKMGYDLIILARTITNEYEFIPAWTEFMKRLEDKLTEQKET